MLNQLTRNVLATSVLSAGLILGGCSGGSSGSSGSAPASNPQPQSNRTVADGVSGPLDEVQTPLSESVFGQLVGAAAGTPLEGTLDCAGQAIVIDLVDVLDSIALALMQTAETQDPATAFEAAAGNVQFSVEEFANDLPGALTALNGSDCNSAGGGDTGGGGDNPLAGTPLEPLGAALAPVLSQFPGAGGEPGDSPDMDLRSVSVLVSQLALAFDAGLAQIPAEARTAPVFGGILTTLSTGLADLSVTLTHFGAYNGDSTAAALETTLNNLLVNVLTNVVPVNFAEAQAGQEGTLSGPIISGVNQITSALGDNLLAAAVPQLTAALDGELSVLLDPIENTLLPALLGPVSTALAGGGSAGGAGSLGVILGPLTEALTGGGSASNPTGTPLDALLGPLLDLTGGSSGSCPFAGTPLAGGCTLFSLLPI
ncbi:MAG TPA: hypothetical protein DIW43_11800 [Spongiibacteraceae bacterium]|nr:hypothetical protein [Spongiibacteraceae bacterium]HCS28131.1 hypothetical protein [Spongiibacteraceae bacterium]